MDKITTYATLKSAVAGMIHRESDTNITGNAPLFIQLCEAELYDRLLLKDMESEESLTLTVGQNYVAIPSGYVSPIALWLIVSGERVKLQPELPENLPYSTSNGQPCEWSIDGANIRFDCPAAEAYSAKFRMMKTSALSDSNTSNALLLKRPDVYLYGAMKQCALFTKDMDDLQKYGSLFEAAIQQTRAAEHRARAIVPLRTEIGPSRRPDIYAGE